MTTLSATGPPGASGVGPPSSRTSRMWRWCDRSILSPAFSWWFHLRVQSKEHTVSGGFKTAMARERFRTD